jgi:hypothetical protein
MLMDNSPGAPTVRVVEAFTAPELALIVVTPVPELVASPAVLASVLMTATVATLELQLTVDVTSC